MWREMLQERHEYRTTLKYEKLVAPRRAHLIAVEEQQLLVRQSEIDAKIAELLVEKGQLGAQIQRISQQTKSSRLPIDFPKRIKRQWRRGQDTPYIPEGIGEGDKNDD